MTRSRLNPLRLASPLLVVSATVAALVGLPVLSVLANIFSGGTGATWSHLAATVLPSYVGNTLVLCLAVGLGVMAVGVATAWLTTMHSFPGRRGFEWALVLPLAMPAYVLAYVYTDFLQFVGPLQSFLRESFGWSKADYWFPEVRSLGGAVVRSRARRLMREAFRLSQHHMAPDLDLILVARRSIVGKRLGPVVRDLHRALREAGLWREDASDPKTPCASSS